MIADGDELKDSGEILMTTSTVFQKKCNNSYKRCVRTIKNAAPKAEEAISYGIPAFKLNGNLVWFAAFKNHIGFYPTLSGIKAFWKELSAYKGAKGSVQFLFDKPLPWLS